MFSRLARNFCLTLRASLPVSPSPFISGSNCTPLSSDARPRKYLSPSGTEPSALSGRTVWIYVSTNGEYRRIVFISACSCATILSTTSVTVAGSCADVAVAGVWAVATNGIAPNAKIAGKTVYLCMNSPKIA